jgi:hypothetical protein
MKTFVAISLLCLVPVVYVFAQAPTQARPESVVLQYIAASNGHHVQAMATLRDFHFQARESFLKSMPGAAPSEEQIEAASRKLEQTFLANAGDDKQDPRTCDIPTVHRESSTVAQVTTTCKRSFGNNMFETSVVGVRLVHTSVGWRIIDDGADP